MGLARSFGPAENAGLSSKIPRLMLLYRCRPILTHMFAKARLFLADDSGATAIEYCLIAAGLSIVIVAAVNGIGTTLNSTFKSVSTTLK